MAFHDKAKGLIQIWPIIATGKTPHLAYTFFKALWGKKLWASWRESPWSLLGITEKSHLADTWIHGKERKNWIRDPQFAPIGNPKFTERI